MCMNNLRESVEQCTSNITINKAKFSVYMIMSQLKVIIHLSDKLISKQLQGLLNVAKDNIQHLKNSKDIAINDTDAVKATEAIDAIQKMLNIEVAKGNTEQMREALSAL